MATFKEREKGFEGKFAHDQEMQFKAAARGSRLFGLWAAGLLGKTGEDATAYATQVVNADLTAAGHEDVIAKVAGDLGTLADDATIRTKLLESQVLAKEQLLAEQKG